jgi:hypothetical protein
VRLFLDTSVLLAACASDLGASREIFLRALPNEWVLVTSPYVVGEVLANLRKLPASASAEWAKLRPMLLLLDDILTVDRPSVFEPAKDRPILFSALAWSDVLLTLDVNGFGGLLEKPFYGLRVKKPGPFLQEERAAGRLK